jgi:hypothetical protein
LRISENSVLRKIFGPEREAITGGLRRVHNAQFHDLYSLPNTGSVVYLAHIVGHFTDHFV